MACLTLWEKNSFSRSFTTSLVYNLGRLTSYTLIGGILGFIGERAAITLQVRGLIGLGAGILMLLISAVAEGSNMDDNGDYRPGLIAAKKLDGKGPLQEVELNKVEKTIEYII